MIQKWSRYTILEQFFDFPRKGFLVRELSRDTKIAATAVRIHIKSLLAEGLIHKNTNGLYPTFSAAQESPLFKILKVQNIVLRLTQSGLIDFLEKTLYPSCIVLFGSASRGEDTENSDIDLFIQAKQVPLETRKFEKAFNRKINVLFEQNITKLPSELVNNLANGIVVYGYLTVA